MLVLGDAMADWLAYGLEDAYAEQPDMGVIRKHKTVSGLIKYQPKGEPADWAAAAKGILATEKPDAIVVMLGLNDRVAIREPVAEKTADKKGDKKDATRKPSTHKPGKPESPRAKPDGGGRCRRQARRQAGRYRIVAGRCRRRERRRSQRRKRARARRTASTNSATSAGSNSTPRRSKR